MKKAIAIILVLLIVCCSSFTALADSPVIEAEDTLPFLATIEDDFEGGILIVYIKKEYSYPNRCWCLDDFGVDEYVTSYVDLTATSDENVIASYLGNPKFRQILQVHLADSNKETALYVAHQFIESPYCYSVSVNYHHDSSEDENDEVQTSLSPVSAAEFENNNRFITGDPYIDCQYGVFTTQSNRAWAITKGSSSVTVGVIDSGIDPIPDLVDNLVPGYNMNATYFADPLPNVQTGTEPFFDADDVDHHGTRVASVIASTQNNIGISGIAPNVKVMPLRVREKGSTGINEIAIVRAFVMAQQLGLKIVNLSINSTNPLETYPVKDPTSMDNHLIFLPLGWLPAMQNFTGLIVNSAGNDCIIYHDGPVDLSDNDIYPGKFKDDGLQNLLVVGTVDEDNDWCVSNWGTDYVDLMAPGRLILTAYADMTRDMYTNEIINMIPKYSYVDGSSFSAPMVAATAALLLSLDNTLTTQQIKECINGNVTYVSELNERCITSGVLNVYKALSYISGAKVSDYCLSICASEDDVFYADNIQVEFPSDRLIITDVYTNPVIQDNSFQEIIVDTENGIIDISFGGHPYHNVDEGEVIYEFWFSEISNPTNPIIAQNNFCIDILDFPIAYGAVMLGDINSDGRVNESDISWLEFLGGNITPAADVNRDHILNSADKLLLQQYVNNEILSLFDGI